MNGGRVTCKPLGHVSESLPPFCGFGADHLSVRRIFCQRPAKDDLAFLAALLRRERGNPTGAGENETVERPLIKLQADR